MRRRRDHPDVAPVDESAGGSTLAPPDPEQLRQEAADLIARAEKIDAEQAEPNARPRLNKPSANDSTST